MKADFAITSGKQLAAGTLLPIGKRSMLIGALILAASSLAVAQNSEMQQKLAGVQQSIQENQQKLHQYQWTETTQLTLKGDPKPPTQDMCQYGPEGKVQKTSMGPSPQQPSGGRMKQKMIEKKEGEMKEYMGEVQDLLKLYVPPNPQKIEQAKEASNVSLNPAGNVVNLVFKNYAQPGDQMTLTFDPAAKKVVGLSVNTYMGQSKDAVTLQVQMASLPDGTNYVQRSVLNAAAKQLVVTTTNSNYQKLGGM